MVRDAMLKRVKTALSEIDSSAEVVLYGSRARGTASTEADWDFLILTDKGADRGIKQAIRTKLYEIEWATGEVVSVVIKSREEWNRPILQDSPFHRNVEREGIHL
ncbi:MAG: UTPGlnB (protein PII) [Geobacteraceae bacterium]|nr:MAG: UTPGlnB (protein PII) [Geobacteraceae bacterium]